MNMISNRRNSITDYSGPCYVGKLRFRAPCCEVASSRSGDLAALLKGKRVPRVFDDSGGLKVADLRVGIVAFEAFMVCALRDFGVRVWDLGLR